MEGGCKEAVGKGGQVGGGTHVEHLSLGWLLTFQMIISDKEKNAHKVKVVLIMIKSLLCDERMASFICCS